MPCHSCIQSLITSGKELGPPNHRAKSLTLFVSLWTALEWVMGRPFPPPQWTLLCQIRCVCTTLPAVFVYKKPRQEPVEWCGWHKVPTGDLESSPTLQPKFPLILSCHVVSWGQDDCAVLIYVVLQSGPHLECCPLHVHPASVTLLWHLTCGWWADIIMGQRIQPEKQNRCVLYKMIT